MELDFSYLWDSKASVAVFQMEWYVGQGLDFASVPYLNTFVFPGAY